MPPADSNPEPIPFETAMGQLEKILRELEEGTISLEDALERYERGIGLLKQCYSQLNKAELKIQQLSGVTEDGKPNLEAFEHTASTEKPTPRPRRGKSDPNT